MNRLCFQIGLVVVCLFSNGISAQVGISNDYSPPHISAMLDITSTTKGLLIPRMTTAQRNNLSATATAGLIVFDTDQAKYFFHDGAAWQPVSTGNLWLTDGPSVYLHDNNDFVGIGTNTPQRKLDVAGGLHTARIGSVDGGAFLEFVSDNDPDWAIGQWAGNMCILSSDDNFVNSLNEYLITQNELSPFLNNTKNLGTASAQWSKLYSVDGSFSGNLGVGTIDPMVKMHVHDANKSHAKMWITPMSNANDSSSIFLSEDAASNYGMYWMFDGINNEMQLWGKALSMHYGPHLRMKRNNGDVAIGDTFANGYKLSVTGKIICTEMRVTLVNNWPDYVFRDDYELMPLDKLRLFVKENGHLPNVPPASEIEASGIEVGKMQRLLMEKIEELSLYILQQQKQIEELKSCLDNLTAN